MPRLPRSPLALAVLIAVVPVAALAVTLGLHRAPAPPRTVASASPTSAALPRLVVDDRFDLAAPRALGRIDVTGIDHHGRITITSYSLAATGTALPESAPVWRLRGFAEVPTTALQARLGVSPPTPEFPGDKFDGLIDLSEARVSAGGAAGTALLDAGAQVTDAGTAVSAVTRVLSQLGLAPQNVDTHAGAVAGDSPEPSWQVTYTRRDVDGIPAGFGLSPPAAQVDISALGNVTRIDIDDPAVDGGAPYRLRTVQDAWQDVSRGHWFDECCAAFTGAAPGPATTAFRGDRVSLAEVQLDAPAMLLVPMYVFTDSTQRLSLTVPALEAADLSEPGGFRLTEPGAG